jgi:hypothetical protein
MATLTLEMPTTAAPSTDSQKFRITQISFGQETFAIKYQLDDGLEWDKPRAQDINAYIVQTASHTEALKEAVKRVFLAEDRWSGADLNIDALKLTYATEEDKGDPKRGINPRPAGTLLRVTISASYQSAFVYTKKDPFLSLGSFDQIVDRDRQGQTGFLDSTELEALQELIDEVSRELARKLNAKTVFKPLQLRLI